MNWPVIGLLITLIVILFGSLSIAAYSILRLVDNGKRLSYYLNYYEGLSNKYRLQLTRIDELTKEAKGNLEFSMHIYNDTSELLSKIKSLVKLAREK